mgnify:CR=1 FL=1
MKLSRPKEYIELLIDSMVKDVRKATEIYFRQTFSGDTPLYQVESEYRAAWDKIDDVKEEILEILEAFKCKED